MNADLIIRETAVNLYLVMSFVFASLSTEFILSKYFSL